MGRKVGLTAAAAVAVVLSVVLMGGEIGPGRFFELGNHEPIYIYGDDEFTVENGVVSGCGTVTEPYVIEGWQIDAPQADYGIYVDHTTAFFVVRDCTVERARLAGVYFNTVRNGRVERSRVGLSDTVVYLLNSSGNLFWRNVLADSLYGFVMGHRSRDNVVAGNTFLDNGMNGYDPYGVNYWAADCRGNYWSDYDGADHDGDGIGDVPYYRVYDPMPLMTPPVDECEPAIEEVPAVTEPETTEAEDSGIVEEAADESEDEAPAVIEEAETGGEGETAGTEESLQGAEDSVPEVEPADDEGTGDSEADGEVDGAADEAVDEPADET